MKPLLDVFIAGNPVPQGRARARIYHAAGQPRIAMYDPAKSRDWKRTVGWSVSQAWGPTHPIEGAVALSLVFNLPRPKSLPKRIVQHTRRPDADNLAKAVKDALRGVVYRDDSQVVELSVRKRYDARLGVSVTVWASPEPAGATILDSPMSQHGGK